MDKNILGKSLMPDPPSPRHPTMANIIDKMSEKNTAEIIFENNKKEFLRYIRDVKGICYSDDTITWMFNTNHAMVFLFQKIAELQTEIEILKLGRNK